MMRTFESSLRWLVPSWLLDGDGGKVLTSLARVLDENVARSRAALSARFPSRAEDDALALTGADRGIPRGRTETKEHYARRLARWRYPFGHRVRASAFGALEQVYEYFGHPPGSAFNVYSQDHRGNRFDYSYALVDGPAVSHNGDLFFWDWDNTRGTLPYSARFWLVLRAIPGVTQGPNIGDPALWGGTVGPAGRGYTIGQSGVSVDDVAAIQSLFSGDTPWCPPGCRPEYAIISFTSFSTPVPTGNWQLSSNRDPAFRYWRLTP